ncbi:hypothetical protein [Rhodopseudomonas palustris]|uniref:Uncharacterized protein n=1 Tax=Rhodopseudomonas palustris (strain BisB18) TaxID=316056 RepID=Q218E4_RHOPB
MADVDKHLDARMARIELAVQRVQLFIVMVVALFTINWCLALAERAFPDDELVMWFYGSRGAALLLGILLSYAAAKIIGYPLKVLARA